MNKTAYLFLIFANVYWGITQVLMKHVLLYMPAETYVMLRYGSAAIIVSLIMSKRIKTIQKETWLKGSLLGVLLALQTGLNTFGLHFTSTSNSVFIAQLSIVIIPLYYLVIYHIKPNKFYYVAVACVIVGLFIFADVIHGSLNIGDFITFISMFFTCGQLVLGASFTKKEDLKNLAVVQMIAAGLSSAIFGMPHIQEVIWCKESITIIILTGVIGSGIANTMRLFAQKAVEPTAVSLINIIHPIFAMIGAALIPNALGETEVIQSYKIIGTIIIVVGLLYYFYHEYQLKRNKEIYK